MLLETSLRFAALIYSSDKLHNTKIIFKQNSNRIIKILCVGDSFTFGSGAHRGYSYPEQLQRILNEREPERFIVFNYGVPGNNSSQLFKNIDKLIQRINPDVMLIMTGANNSSNFAQSNYFLFIANSPKVCLYRVDVFLSHLRSYKLFKIIAINLFHKINPRIESKVKYFKTPNQLTQGIGKNDISDDMLEQVKKHLESAKVFEENIDISSAIKECKKAIEINPYDGEAHYFLGFLYLDRSRELGNEANLLAIPEFRKAIKINPIYEEAHEKLFSAYFRADEKKLAWEELKILCSINSKNESCRNLLIYGIPNSKDRMIFKQMLRYDLENIIKPLFDKNLKIILLSYPGENWPNEVLRQVAVDYDLPFVDNESKFNELELLNGYKKEYYFAEDGHANANGYKIIADNVYKILNFPN